MRNLFAIIAAVVLISGGAYSTVWAVDVTKGNEKISKETTESIGTKVTKGVTTKDQIKELFGEPQKVTLSYDGGLVWKYRYSESKAKAANYIPCVRFVAGGRDVHWKLVVFFFNKNNVVQNYDVSSSGSDGNQQGK